MFIGTRVGLFVRPGLDAGPRRAAWLRRHRRRRADPLQHLLSDFAVRPSPHRRLSKLILACLVSREVQADCEQWLCSRLKAIGTTAFTDRPVSMKYRGLLDVHSRSEGKVNYLGPAGRWSLKEGFKWWKTKHAAK